MTSQQIVPNIWCRRNAQQMGEFYSSILPEARAQIASRYPSTGLAEFQHGFEGEPLTVALHIGEYEIVLINAGDEFRPGPALSFMLNFDPAMFGEDEAAARAQLGNIWRELADGGTERMPLGEYPFSKRYGWVEDRFGVNWQLMLTNPEGEPRPFVIPALMFNGREHSVAAEATDFYVSLFAGVPGGAAAANRQVYGERTGTAGPESLAFGEFRVGDQWFMASDNGSGVDHAFSCGVSLEVRCAGQYEIDRLWSALSNNAHAEQCGWAEDRFGVAWQIVPDNMDELMQRPGAFEHLMSMKKLVIADF